MHTKGIWKWFAVKTVFRAAPQGPPLGRDRSYDPSVTLIEERVVLFRARSHEEARARAAREASRYCSEVQWRNPYGQPVVVRALSRSDSFELFYSPASGAEVYSRTEVVPRSVPDRSCVKGLLGPAQEPARLHARRRNILDITFEKPAPGVARTAEDVRSLQPGPARKRPRS